MACFADINVSQGSVATYASCGGIFSIHLSAYLRKNLPVSFCKSVKIWQNYSRESVAPLFWPTLYTAMPTSTSMSESTPGDVVTTCPWRFFGKAFPFCSSLFFPFILFSYFVGSRAVDYAGFCHVELAYRFISYRITDRASGQGNAIGRVRLYVRLFPL